MKIELVFTKTKNGFDDGSIIVGKFTTKKSAYLYVKVYRKFYSDGYFSLCISKHNNFHFEPVYAQDLLNV